jgi:hypothetical protein
MAEWGLHINTWPADGKARATAMHSPHLKILSTAVNQDILAEWRGKFPFGLLVYREWFSDSASKDVTYRCDQLLRNAEAVQMFMPILEIPWNEERQSGDELSRYSEDSVKATLRIRAEGYPVAVGNFSVTWPTVSDALRYLPAFAVADYHSFHEYSWPTMADAWGRIGHYKAVEGVLPASARKPVLLTEFGLDKLCIGIRGGYRDAGLSGEQYAPQLRTARKQVATAEVAFIYCCGQFGDWAGYDVAGESAIETLLGEIGNGGESMALKDQYPIEFRQWESAGGVANNFRAHLLGIGVLTPTKADVPILAGQVKAATDQLTNVVARLPFA